MKIVTIVGARPQFVKAAAVSREFAKHSQIEEVIIHTGQHFDQNMSNVFFEEMQIPPPHYHLEINSLGHGAMTGRMLEKIEEVLIQEKPDYVMVYGDTNSTLAGALAAKKIHIRVIHVEAGLRSFNMMMPEEVNRILTDRLSDILCCPTDNAVENLGKEGFKGFPCTIIKTGDVMQDAALFYGEYSAQKSDVIARHGLHEKDFILATIHRAENTDNPERLAAIVGSLNEISREIPVVMPLHPRTRKIIASSSLSLEFEPLDPVGYFDMLELLKATKLVLTDSGGVQKEAYFFSKPCLTLREETEWGELLAAGANALVGADKAAIISGAKEMIAKTIDFSQQIYGSGRAAEALVASILHLDRP